MGKDSRGLPGQALLDAALFDPIEVMVRDRYGGSSRTLWRRNWTTRWDARVISVLEPLMSRAVRPAIGMGGEHADCLVRLAQ
jgi:hypothetical protein